MDAWAHGLSTLYEISKLHPQLDYTILGISLQLKWQYLQRTIPVVGTLVGYIRDSLRETFFPAILGGRDVNDDYQKILGLSIKRDGLVISESQRLEDN